MFLANAMASEEILGLAQFGHSETVGEEKNLMTFLMWVNGFVDTDVFNEVLLYSHSIWSARVAFFCLKI